MSHKVVNVKRRNPEKEKCSAGIRDCRATHQVLRNPPPPNTTLTLVQPVATKLDAEDKVSTLLQDQYGVEGKAGCAAAEFVSSY